MISIIAAIGLNNEIGLNNKLLWHIKEDLQNFKKLTMNKYIVMGANTYYSLPKKLAGRKYIVLSSKIKNIDNGLVFNDFDNCLDFVKKQEEEVMIIGGASIYKQFIPYADKIYLTEIMDTKEADAFFPEFSKEKYKKIIVKEETKEDLKYNFVIYER